MAVEKRSMRVMSYNAKGPVLIGINKTKCAAIVHRYDVDILLMQNIQRDALNTAINDGRYVSNLRHKESGLVVYRRQEFGQQPAYNYDMHRFGATVFGYQMFLEHGFIMVNCHFEDKKDAASLVNRNNMLDHMWTAVKSRVDDDRAYRGAIVCGHLGLDPNDPLDYDKLHSWLAITGLKIAAYTQMQDYIIWRSPKFDAGKPFLHTADVIMVGDDENATPTIGKNIPMSATFTHAGD